MGVEGEEAGRGGTSKEVPASAGSQETLVLFYKWKLNNSEQISGTWDIGTGGRPQGSPKAFIQLQL